MDLPHHAASSSTTRTRPGMSDLQIRIEELLGDLPSRPAEPARYEMVTELVKMRTRELELEIADARRREKEAEVELERLKAASRSLEVQASSIDASNGMAAVPESFDFSSFVDAPQASNPDYMLQSYGNFQPATLAPSTAPTSADPTFNPQNGTSFDVDSLLQESSLDGFLNWLPTLGGGAGVPTTMDPTQLAFPPSAFSVPLQQDPSFDQGFVSAETASIKRRVSASTLEVKLEEGEGGPPSKRSKKYNRRTVLEDTARCLTCATPLARVILRLSSSDNPKTPHFALQCLRCKPGPSTAPDDGAHHDGIVTPELRKRLRASMEALDEGKWPDERRIFCDICQRHVASGQITDGQGGDSLLGSLEIVCAACDGKYQRCTDCGGGGGSRIGIGRWRMKQVFPPGRKTCSLSHIRVGDRPRELGVHQTPTDFAPTLLKEVLSRCQSLWQEKTLARLAVPEMLELDLPPGIVNPLQSYSDVEAVINRNWPSREAVINAVGADPKRFKRVLGLIWAHAKPRRNVNTVDLEEDYAKNDGGVDHSTVLANVTHTDVVIPPGSDLIAMWGGEWDMEQGSLLVSTLIPFEGADGEDSTALLVGEMITKCQSLRAQINEEGVAAGRSDLLPQCEHLWVVSGGTSPLVRERVAEVLTKKRSFVPVEEYLTRHPGFVNALKARPRGLHPDLDRPDKGSNNLKPLVLVRWLGRDFDPERVLEIKQQEFGSKAKPKKKAKGKAVDR